VHFHKNNRHLARFCHMPADLDLFLDQSTPRVGNLIMVQDKRFAKLLLGQVSYTVDTLEHKLTIGKNGEANTDLVRLAKKHLGLS
ncbi:MAG: hypothetical protein P4L61_03660, partial [Candidatus Pacebacteria bacterium]|nr:hypothetical protein [Candidatus Paceibacterota bacterium]